MGTPEPQLAEQEVAALKRGPSEPPCSRVLPVPLGRFLSRAVDMQPCQRSLSCLCACNILQNVEIQQAKQPASFPNKIFGDYVCSILQQFMTVVSDSARFPSSFSLPLLSLLFGNSFEVTDFYKQMLFIKKLRSHIETANGGYLITWQLPAASGGTDSGPLWTLERSDRCLLAVHSPWQALFLSVVSSLA